VQKTIAPVRPGRDEAETGDAMASVAAANIEARSDACRAHGESVV
jgi:hypothetical protein